MGQNKCKNYYATLEFHKDYIENYFFDLEALGFFPSFLGTFLVMHLFSMAMDVSKRTCSL